MRLKSIPYELIASIHSRYLNLDFGKGLSEREKLQAMVEYVNSDRDLSDLLHLDSHFMIGSLVTVEQVRGNGTLMGAGSGSGLNVCLGRSGLYIYDWNDFESKWNVVPLTPDALEGVGIKLTAEEIRDAIADYVEENNYVDRVADFNKTFKESGVV